MKFLKVYTRGLTATWAVFGLFLLVIAIHWSLVWHAWELNIGLVKINQGLVSGQGEVFSKGQRFLSDVRDDRYRSIVEGELELNNLILNGGFEFNGHGWVIGGPGRPQWTREKAHSGLQSLVIDFENGVDFYHSYQKVAVQPDTCYRLEAYVSAENLPNRVGLEVWDGERGHAHWYGGRTSLVTGTVPWTLVELEFCTDSDTQQTRILVRSRGEGEPGKSGLGTAWFDDIRLEPLH
jgi:hypothetical protein